MTAVNGSRLPSHIADRLRIPVISAPMLRVSGPELAGAACREGVVGAFPTANARSIDQLDEWIATIRTIGGADAAPLCPNLIIRQPRMHEDLACLIRNEVELVITSVGSPRDVVGPLHEIGALVLADVATMRHAEKAIEDGVDGLVLLSAGAGGQTGWMNPFAFVRAVRRMYDGIIVLAGGITDGVALRAAVELGCDLGYVGTGFIATEESRAEPEYKQMITAASMDDVLLTKAFTGLQTSMLIPSILAAGLNPAALDESVTPQSAAEMFGAGAHGPKRWSEVWSAGHSVSGYDSVVPVAQRVAQLAREYVDPEAGNGNRSRG